MTEQPKSDVQLCCEALAAAQQVWLEHEQAQRLTSSGVPSEVDELRQQLADALEAQQILGQRVVELEAELKQVNEHADNCTDIVLDQYQRAEQAESERDALRRVAKEEVWYWQGDGHDDLESLTCPVLMPSETLRALLAERDAARAGLGRALDVVRDLHAECCMPWVTVVRDQYTLRMQPVLKRAEQICADPLGQQALAEWQHLKTVADHVLKVKADGWYFSDPELAAAVEALAALRQQPAAGEGQQDG